MLLDLQEKYRDCKNVSWDFERDNIYSMKKSDIMISDFSGIIYDYTFLCDKPVIYVNANLDLRPYDAYDIDGGKNIWQFKTLKEIGIELDDSNFESIESIIKNATDSADLAEKRKKAKQEAWMHQSEAGKNIVEFMIQKATQQGE
mgnify:FL=1